MRAETISRKIRRRFYYSVPHAGRMIGLGRSQSYRAVELGRIPAERDGKFLLVPRKPWDREVKRLLRGLSPRGAVKRHGRQKHAYLNSESPAPAPPERG
jgi:hypothetical protein